MASISSISGSSGTSSLYNSANIISGLASGMDTEGMIESLVQSYQNKIQSLTNNITKLGWKQEAYRSIISKLAAFSSNYTSYTSPTNLMSASFFRSAVKVAAQGENGSKVSASGRTESNIVLNGVRQMATAARYVTKSNLEGDTKNTITAAEGMDFNQDVTLSNLTGTMSFVYGTKTVSISFDEINDRIGLDEDGKPTSLTADEKAEKLGALIEEKLGDQKITLSNGESVAASERIGVRVGSGGAISFYDKADAGNSVYISSASDAIQSTLGLGDLDDSDNRVSSIEVKSGTKLTRDVKAYEYLSGKSININLDGVSKSIQMPQIVKLSQPDAKGNEFKLTMPSTVKDKYGNISYVYDTSKLDKNKYTVVRQGDTAAVKSGEMAEAYKKMLSDGVNKAFGDKVKVTNLGENGELKLNFEVKEGSSLLINTSVGETLGIGRTATNYLNTTKTLGELLGDKFDKLAEEAGGDKVDFIINGEKIGSYDKDAKLTDIMNDINNSDAGVKVNYSKTTREFVFASKETGSNSRIDMGEGLAEAIFGSTNVSETSTGTFGDAYGVSWLNGQEVHFQIPGASGDFACKVGKDATIEDVAESLNKHLSNFDYTAAYNKYTGQLEITNDKTGAKADVEMWVDGGFGKQDLKFNEDYAPAVEYTPGQDAKFTVTVNGTRIDMTRGSNTVDIDGMTIKFNETFDESEGGPVTFQTTTDSDKIIDAMKSMIADYNEVMAELRSAYATMPPTNSSGSFATYEPLSEDEMAKMSESAIQRYEEKAKQGLLFGDSNLRGLYERMQAVFQPSGTDSVLLSKMGISVSFSSVDNSTTIVLDEDKMRTALENNPDEVADFFTRSTESGASSNGIMQGLKTQLDRYAGLTGSVKGILVQQAGTPLNSLSLLDNQWQKEIENLNTQIEKWQDKLESQVDRYTSMFSKLEVLINQMNSQSSTLAGLMGG